MHLFAPPAPPRSQFTSHITFLRYFEDKRVLLLAPLAYDPTIRIVIYRY